jgi:hypothetical protein
MGSSLESDKCPSCDCKRGWANDMREDRSTIRKQHDDAKNADNEQNCADDLAYHFVTPSSSDTHPAKVTEHQIHRRCMRQPPGTGFIDPKKSTSMQRLQQPHHINAANQHARGKHEAQHDKYDDQRENVFPSSALVLLDFHFLKPFYV